MKTGLSVKRLGWQEYRRRYYIQKFGVRRNRNWWSGLSKKMLGEAVYTKLYRELKSKRTEQNP